MRGDPYFDAVLEHFGDFDLPACVRRISVPVPGLDGVGMVGYAVACRGPADPVVAGLNSLQLAESESLTEAEVNPLREQLERMVWEEMQPYLAAERIERANVRAAHAHEILNYLAARLS